MSEIPEIVMPRTPGGNDPADHRDDPEWAAVVQEMVDEVEPPKQRRYFRRTVAGEDRSRHGKNGGSRSNAAGENEEPRSGFQLLGLSDIRKGLKGPQYLIKPFLERETTTVMFGESGAYKSFVALDQALCVAFGEDYHGHTTHQGGVVYICGEGQGGIARRVEAWLIHHNLTGKQAPFFISSVPAELFSIGNAAAIGDVVAKKCPNPAFIVIDTLSTNMGGNGDESSNPDIAALLTNINVNLRDRFGACVEIVHHVGHGDGERERGAYAIRGNADSRILIKQEPGFACSMHSKKAKDASLFAPISFKTKIIKIPEITDSEGEEVTSLVLESTEYVDSSDEKRLSAQKGQALACLKDMYHTARTNLERGGYDAKNARVATKEWREKTVNLEIVASNRNSFYKVKKALIDAGLVVEESGFCQPVSGGNFGE